MSEIDPRKKFLLSQVRTTLQLTEAPRSFFDNAVVDDFLNTADVNAIRIFVDPKSNKLEVRSINDHSTNGDKSAESAPIAVCITKVEDGEIAPEEIQKKVIFSTMNNNPLFTLLNQLTNVYLPTLGSAKWADHVDHNIKRLLDELKAGLDDTLAKGGSGRSDEVIYPWTYLF